MKIAIAGYGVEGKANYAYWAKDPANELTIVDEAESLADIPAGAATILGPGAFQKLDGFDMVIRTAGLSPYKIKTDGKVWSGTNEFMSRCPAPVIGVTGTKGKGTTSSFIAEILKAAGRKVWLVGNIGMASLDVLADITADDIVVYEMSSFQLWDCQYSPHTAVVLFIEQEHLDVHRDMDDYVEAKRQIVAHQTEQDLTIYAADNEYARHIGESSKGVKIGYPSNVTAHIRDGYFWNGEQKLCSTDAVTLVGEHNLTNAIAAINAVWEYTQSPEAIEKGLGFKGLPHRLAYVDTVRGIRYYDDSIATTPTSAIAAVDAFPDTHKVLILGGSSKGSDFSQLPHQLADKNVDVLLVGKEGQRIRHAFEAASFARYEVAAATTMHEIVAQATALARSGSVVLLSPSAASFDMFKNYADRGDQFIAAVHALKDAEAAKKATA